MAFCFLMNYQMTFNRIGGVMVSVLSSIVVDRGCEHRSGQTKDYNIGICCFSGKHEIRIISNQEKYQRLFGSESG
jgi:hypothetical protein